MIERVIFIIISLISISSLLFIPKEKIRIALISFIAFQTTTWLTAIILTQLGNVVYPVREFVKATNINFIPQFLFYPSIFVWFILLFPKDKSTLIKMVHYTFFVSIMWWFIYFTYKYTDIYSFTSSSDSLIIIKGYSRNFLQFAICHLYINWFESKEKLA